MFATKNIDQIILLRLDFTYTMKCDLPLTNNMPIQPWSQDMNISIVLFLLPISSFFNTYRLPREGSGFGRHMRIASQLRTLPHTFHLQLYRFHCKLKTFHFQWHQTQMKMSSQSTSTTLPTKVPKVRQACDCCHGRKIRCGGTQPCLNCVATSLNCTYLAIPKKKGPKGKRNGKEALRKPISQPFNVPIPQVVASQSSPAPAIDPAISEQPPLPDSDIFDDPSFGFTEFQPSVLVTNEIMMACLSAFFIHKYPITPILDREELFLLLPNIQHYPEQYALIAACLSMIVLSPEIITPPVTHPDLLKTLPSSDFLISETIRARQYCDHIEAPTLATVHTSFFLFSAFFCQGKDNSAWFYIREAMTTLQLLRLHEEATYDTLTPSYGSDARRTFWLLFITERAYALQRHRPLTLQRTIDLPFIPSNHAEATILSGFLDLLSLFSNFDDDFLSLWNLSTINFSTSGDSLVKLQAILKSALPNVSQRTEIQQADLLVSQQWLKTMVWQLCVSKGLLSSQSSDESMSFQYPITIARDVVHVSRSLSSTAFEANGVGILEKVFDIGCSLADVMLLSKSASIGGTMHIGPREYLVELVNLLGTVLGGSSKYLQLLAAKADECVGPSVRGSLSSSGEESRIQELDDDDYEFADDVAVKNVFEMLDFAADETEGSREHHSHSYQQHAAYLPEEGQVMFGPERPPLLDTSDLVLSPHQSSHPQFSNDFPFIRRSFTDDIPQHSYD